MEKWLAVAEIFRVHIDDHGPAFSQSFLVGLKKEISKSSAILGQRDPGHRIPWWLDGFQVWL